MAILADCHLHSHHSGDSTASMEEMILQGIRQGLRTMCFTEHNDFDYPDSEEGPGTMFLLNVDSYLYELLQLKEKYKNEIQILFGVELGLTDTNWKRNALLSKAYDFDFIIGSSHICYGMDPYYPAFFEGRTEREAYGLYFSSILDNLKKFTNFDVYGHLDYVVRYGPTKDLNYNPADYQDIIDTILRFLIDHEKGIEINTGGYARGMRDLHPALPIIKRYKELGGEIITIGSDSHHEKTLGICFDKAAESLRACGFQYYTVFQNRLPEFRRL